MGLSPKVKGADVQIKMNPVRIGLAAHASEHYGRHNIMAIFQETYNMILW